MSIDSIPCSGLVSTLVDKLPEYERFLQLLESSGLCLGDFALEYDCLEGMTDTPEEAELIIESFAKLSQQHKHLTGYELQVIYASDEGSVIHEPYFEAIVPEFGDLVDKLSNLGIEYVLYTQLG